MGDPLQRVRSGQPLRFPAAAYNAFAEATEDYQRRKGRQGGGPLSEPLPAGIVLVQNNSGADLPAFSILTINGLLFALFDSEGHDVGGLDEFKFHFALNGQAPDADHPGNFVVLQEPIPAGELGRAMVAGVTPVQVTIKNEGDQYAEVRSDGEEGWDFLSGSVGSAQILWHEAGTGVQWSLVRLGNRVTPQVFPARITGGSTGAWEWTEIVPGTCVDNSGGLSSDTEGTLSELNGTPLGVDDRVFVQPLFVPGTGWTYTAHDDSRDL